MTSIISLPTEILHTIFNHLDKIKDIAACRLVCHAWNAPAERSMFEHGVTLADNRMGAMQALYHVLVKNPEKGNWIKRLTLDLPYNQHPLVMSRLLLLLALTPSITTISGDIGDRTLLRRMVDKIQDSEQKFDGLKELTVRPFLFGTPHHDLALSLCKDTLEKLKLDGTTDLDFLSALDQLTRLTSLMLYLPNATMTTLSMVLDKCPHVHDLNLTLEWKNNTVFQMESTTTTTSQQAHKYEELGHQRLPLV